MNAQLLALSTPISDCSLETEGPAVDTFRGIDQLGPDRSSISNVHGALVSRIVSHDRTNYTVELGMSSREPLIILGWVTSLGHTDQRKTEMVLLNGKDGNGLFLVVRASFQTFRLTCW